MLTSVPTHTEVILRRNWCQHNLSREQMGHPVRALNYAVSIWMACCACSATRLNFSAYVAWKLGQDLHSIPTRTQMLVYKTPRKAISGQSFFWEIMVAQGPETGVSRQVKGLSCVMGLKGQIKEQHNSWLTRRPVTWANFLGSSNSESTWLNPS